MEDKTFDVLLQSVAHMGKHMRGEKLDGVKLTTIPDVEPKDVRKAVGLSQAEFARLLNVPISTVRNWEQHRTKPAGTARALLRMAAKEPQTVARLLAA